MVHRFVVPQSDIPMSAISKRVGFDELFLVVSGTEGPLETPVRASPVIHCFRELKAGELI